MFTTIAFFALAFIAWASNRAEMHERKDVGSEVDDTYFRARVLFIRQDIRLIVYLLASILMMLAVVADRLR